mmetsp:Transcript_9581/g.35511  ORF Transcript_9581/g.35511 Transcript_9581/m.35511 type:complete len:509 (-) Transcript_9581:130-1656(-)
MFSKKCLSLTSRIVSNNSRRSSFGIVSTTRLYDTAGWNKQLNAPLKEVDSQLYEIIEGEKKRQYTGLQLIPSENFTSKAVLDALGSPMQNKYSEGYPGQRYYGGNEFIDQAESLCQKRALELFDLDPEKWGVNVQPLSGSPANFYVYSALLPTHGRILSMDLPDGGHLSHGFQLPNKKISKVSEFYETLPYRLDPATGLINYDEMEFLAQRFRPKLIVCGASSYSRTIDHEYFRKVSDDVGAILMSDMAHVSGLVAAKVIPSPFEHCDIVTTTTHKSLRGPRGAMIFYRKGSKTVQKGKNTIEVPYNFEDRINQAVFPGHQGGPHNHTISALAAALKLANTPEFREYQIQVVENCRVLSQSLKSLGYKIVSDGTDNHLILVDLKNKGIDGARVEKVYDVADIACNKNTVPGDKSALVPGGIRVGSPAMTSRGMLINDFEKIAEFMDRGVQIAIKIKKDADQVSKKVADFKTFVDEHGHKYGIPELRKEVQDLCTQFPTVGYTLSKEQL